MQCNAGAGGRGGCGNRQVVSSKCGKGGGNNHQSGNSRNDGEGGKDEPYKARYTGQAGGGQRRFSSKGGGAAGGNRGGVGGQLDEARRQEMERAASGVSRRKQCGVEGGRSSVDAVVVVGRGNSERE